MKWTKFDPENPPRSEVLFMFDYEHGENECDTFYYVGRWVQNLGFIYYYSEGQGCFSADEMPKYNAHWIYPQLLEMQE